MKNLKKLKINQAISYQRGVTLIELLIVIVIIGLLASIIVINLLPLQEKATIEKAKNDIHILHSALDQYKIDNFSYPTTNQGLEALISPPYDITDQSRYRNGGYLQKKQIPKDPWGTPYQYLNPGEFNEIDVFSLGSDKQPGGTGSAKDIYGFE